MNKIIPLSLITILSLSSISVHAGFLSQFFANVASDSLKSNGSNGQQAIDPSLREKKMQGALGAMGYYKQYPDGDLNTFESRIGIKQFQKFLGAEQTGMLLNTEKEQLLYLSNLYTELKKANIADNKKYAVYEEIDATIDAMSHKDFYEGVLNYFDSTEKARVIASEEDATVYIDGKEVGTILLGYFTARLTPGSYKIKVEKFTEDGEWQITNSRQTTIKGNETNIVEISLDTLPTAQRNSRITKKLKKARALENAELAKLSTQGINYSLNNDGTVADYQNNLVWMRCPIDQLWNGYSCEVDPNYKNLDASFNALNASAEKQGQQKWRIPTVNELKTLVYCSSGQPYYRNNSEESCLGSFASPTIATAIFPNTPTASFWSSTKTRDFMMRTKAKFVNFENGSTFSSSSGDDKKLRLVKSLMDKTSPIKTNTSQEPMQYRGVFHDKVNHLVWEDSSVSAEQKLIFSSAKAHCQSMAETSQKPWRLPSNAELATFFKYQYSAISIKHPHDFAYGQHYLMSNVENLGFDFEARGNTKLRSTALHFRCVYNTPERDEMRNELAKKYGLPKHTDSIVIETMNHLVWENNLNNEKKRIPPKKAIERCNSLNIDGITGWKMPDSKQLRELFKQKPAYSTALVQSDKAVFMSIKRDYAYKINKRGEKVGKGLINDNDLYANTLCVKQLAKNN